MICLFCFAACGDTDYGALSVADIENLKIGETRGGDSRRVFGCGIRSAIEYEFKCNAIQIEDGKVTALSGGRTVSVTAKTESKFRTAMFVRLSPTKQLQF